MTEIRYTVTDVLGVHARPAGQLVKESCRHECSVQAGRENQMVDAKSILGVMALAIKQGEELVMRFEGDGEAEAAAALGSFLRQTL